MKDDVRIDRKFGHMVRTATQSHIELKNHYAPEDIAHLSYAEDIGDPGDFPFTRGLYREMYRNRLWLKSYLVSYTTIEETNRAMKDYVANGLTDIRFTTDLPTQCGIDPDHPSAWNSMACGGLPSYALHVYEGMLDGLPLEDVVYEIGMMGTSNYLYFHSLLVAMMEKKGLDLAKLHGNGINDPIRGKLVYGARDFPLHIDKRIWIDHIEFAIRSTPRWKACVPNGVDPQQSGMAVPQEVGGCIAVAIAMAEELAKRGISLDYFGPMIFSLDAESDFFETICKFRAARKLWAKVAKERLGAQTKRAMQLKIGVRTSGLSLTWQKPLNNAARVVLQVLSSVLGGVNSIDASGIDEAIGLPSYEARMYNLDAQHVITHEANVPLVADPLGGSYYVEWLTSRIETETSQYLAEIDAAGGIFAFFESGRLAQYMDRNRDRIEREKADFERLVVGVNAFQSEGEEGPINRAIENTAYKVPTVADRERIVADVKAFKESRDYGRLKPALARLHDDTKNDINVSRAVIEAAKAGATIGEVVGTIRDAYGVPYDPFNIVEMPAFARDAVRM
ncbi:MAG: methylmalonyl-CoA mutase family protein [Gammaproteobacteria bacterium]